MPLKLKNYLFENPMPNPDEDFDDILNDVFNSQEERHRKVPAEVIFDALPPQIGEEIMDILNSSNDTFKLSRKLQPVMLRFEKDLAEAGWDASYAAYALIHATQELRRRQQ